MFVNPKHRKRINILWGIVVVLIALSMILLSMPSLFR
jgi:hypothetical protein